MTPEIMDRLNSSSQLTLFLPMDGAWNRLDPIERLYLESKFATDDLHRILDMHTVAKAGVVWSDSFDRGLSCKASSSPLKYKLIIILSNICPWLEIEYNFKSGWCQGWRRKTSTPRYLWIKWGRTPCFLSFAYAWRSPAYTSEIPNGSQLH